MTLEKFLDRLMMAESDGRDNIANPRSTAVGAFQFIVPTWIEVMRRHFGEAAAGKTLPQLLALRTDRTWSRRAAEAYTKDNAAYLAAQGLTPSYPNLRLAFLVGPQGAMKILTAPPATPVASVLGQPVTQANPFMAGMTAAGLIARAARDISADPASAAGITVAAADGAAAKTKRKRPAVDVRCNLGLPSCKRWLALAERRVLRTLATATPAVPKSNGKTVTR